MSCFRLYCTFLSLYIVNLLSGIMSFVYWVWYGGMYCQFSYFLSTYKFVSIVPFNRLILLFTVCVPNVVCQICPRSPVFCTLSQELYIFHVLCQLFLVLCPFSYIFCLVSIICCLIFLVLSLSLSFVFVCCHVSLASCLLSFVFCPLSCIYCHASFIFCQLSCPLFRCCVSCLVFCPCLIVFSLFLMFGLLHPLKTCFLVICSFSFGVFLFFFSISVVNSFVKHFFQFSFFAISIIPIASIGIR